MLDSEASTTENQAEGEPTSSTVSSYVIAKKEPPPETIEGIRLRRHVIVSYWLIVIIFGLPIWWKTTSIYRASLPLNQMMDWANGKACRPVFPLPISIEVGSLSDQDAHNLLRSTQHALDDLNDFSAHHLRLHLSHVHANDSTATPVSAISSSQEVAMTIRLIPDTEMKTNLHSYSSILDIHYTPNQVPSSSSSSSPLATYITHHLRALFAEERSMISHLLSTSSSDHTSEYTAPAKLQKWTSHTMKYSPSYHLTFSLFTPTNKPATWPIAHALKTEIEPILKSFHQISNFTIDTQIQFFAAPGISKSVLREEDLSHFVNAAEWPLSPSIGGSPTINFVIYAGDIEIEGGAKSWLIPQWGGVVLLSPSEVNDLRPAMLIFANQLMSLLGVPETGSFLFRLQTLSRVHSASLLLKASSTLGSLSRLSLALPSISIPRSVADGVSKTISSLEVACAELGGRGGLRYARIAEREAEKAFFEKSMVGQVYFPDEHKVAVYLPLLGPVGVPLIMGIFKEGKSWAQKRMRLGTIFQNR